MKANPTSQAYEDLIGRITRFAEADENIRAAFIIGSYARSDHPADEWSDLDVILIVQQIDVFHDQTDWINAIHPYWLTFVETMPGGGAVERRVLFAGGLDVDFVPFPVNQIQFILDNEIPAEIADALRRGVRVLTDKDLLIAQLLEIVPPIQPLAPPAASELCNAIDDFWYHAVWTAKHLRRRELWWAKSSVDGRMKDLLRQMLAWHAQATRGSETDTWLRGRFLEEWADPRAVAALEHVYARYREEEVWTALFATMELFSWLSRETTRALHLPYPEESETHAAELVRQMFDGRPQ